MLQGRVWSYVPCAGDAGLARHGYLRNNQLHVDLPWGRGVDAEGFELVDYGNYCVSSFLIHLPIHVPTQVTERRNSTGR